MAKFYVHTVFSLNLLNLSIYNLFVITNCIFCCFVLDCNFLFAEVNADKLFWLYKGPNQPLKLVRKDTLAIGQLIR